MKFSFTVHHSEHEGGTKYYSLVLINAYLGDKVYSSRLYRIYGSIEKQTILWRADVDLPSDVPAKNIARNQYLKTLNSKIRGGYHELGVAEVFDFEKCDEVADFCSLHSICLGKSLFEVLGSIESDNFIDYINDLYKVQTDPLYKTKKDSTKSKEKQEKLFQMRQEHYGEVLGSW